MNAIAFQTKLNSDFVQHYNFKGFIVEKSIISIIELQTIEPKKNQRKLNLNNTKDFIKPI